MSLFLSHAPVSRLHEYSKSPSDNDLRRRGEARFENSPDFEELVVQRQSTNRSFPCPVCTKPTEVRITKKNKPYLTCDPCGVQLFIRGPAGISEFNRLLESASGRSAMTQLAEIEQRYRLSCPKCGTRFWAEPYLVKTSTFDGSFKGFHCPEKNCSGIALWGQEQ